MSKIAIVYFSVYGSTEKFANTISELTGGDLFKVIPLTKYDSDKNNYEILAKIAEAEMKANDRPVIEKINIKDYDTVFLGYPIWWYTMPMAVFTFLEGNDLKEKTIIPFCTHEGSKESNTYEVIRKICKDCKVLDGLDIPGSKFIYDQTIEIEDWINKLGIK